MCKGYKGSSNYYTISRMCKECHSNIVQGFKKLYFTVNFCVDGKTVLEANRIQKTVDNLIIIILQKCLNSVLETLCNIPGINFQLPTFN